MDYTQVDIICRLYISAESFRQNIEKLKKKNENQGINVHEYYKTEEGRLLIHEK